MHNQTDVVPRPLLGRLIGWNAVFAAVVAAALIAASMVQLRSGQALSAGALTEAAPAVAAEPAASMAELAAAPMPAQTSGAGMCETVSDTAEFEVGESRTLAVPGFDVAKGELDSVMVGTSVSFTSAGSVTNAGVVPFTFRSYPGFIFVAGISGPDVTGVSVDRFSPLFTELEIPASEMVDISVGSEAATGMDTPPLAGYIGGSIEFPATSVGEIAIELGPNADATIRSTVTATVDVKYCFTPPPAMSSITISKAVNASPGADVGTFSFTINCGGADVAVEVGAGLEVTLPLDGVADGTVCSVSETADPTRWLTEVNGVCGTSISITAPGRADFTNTLKAGSETPLGACAP